MRPAFTLIELLVVMAIILILSSIIFATISAGQSSQDQQRTQALVITITAAIDQFTSETGAVPLPTGSKADPQSGTWYPSENDGAWDKQQLWWRLSSDMDKATNDAMNAAAQATSLAEDPYQSGSYQASLHPTVSTRVAAIKAIMDTIPDAEANAYKFTYADNRWAYEATYPGGIDVRTNAGLSYRGVYKSFILADRAAIAVDLEKRKYKTFACLDMEDLIDESFLDDNTIVDAWGMPLIYAAHSTISIKERKATSGATTMLYKGEMARGRQLMTDRDGNGVINASDWKLQPPAAEDQVDHDGDGDVDVDDWGSILWNARVGRGLSFYTASAGPDTKFNCLLFHDDNYDNIEMKYKE